MPDVEAPRGERAQLLARAHRHRHGAHRRVPVREAWGGELEQPRAEVLGVAHADLAPARRGRPAGDLDGGAGGEHGAPRLGEEGLADLGERHPPAGAREQRGAELALEAADLLAHRLLPHVQALRGAPEVPFLGDREDVLELPQLHARLPIDRLSLSERSDPRR